MNLCINARDAMAGCGSIIVRLHYLTGLDTVCTACRQPVTGDFVELAVQDTGPGIAPEILERMFEPFFSTKARGKGSGMGLATVHGIVHEHGGHIVVDTTPGEGAKFRILFKPAESMSLEKAQPEPMVPADSQSHQVLAGQVLVVDDEELVGEFMKELLESWGLEVTLKTCSLAAQTAFVSCPQQFDLVITDQVMPKMTGLILAQRFLNIRPNLPIILYTGYSDSLTEQQFGESGIRAILRKPLDFNELFTAVKYALASVSR
jgi:CheY-like chemotaxis protein